MYNPPHPINKHPTRTDRVRGANGNEDVCVCRRESGEEHRFEWKIKPNGDFIIMLYNVQRPAPESSNGDVTPRNDSQ